MMGNKTYKILTSQSITCDLWMIVGKPKLKTVVNLFVDVTEEITT